MSKAHHLLNTKVELPHFMDLVESCGQVGVQLHLVLDPAPT